MARRFLFNFLAIALLVLCGGAGVNAEGSKSMYEVRQKLKLLNKPAVKTIKSKDGDIIDCVKIHRQPAFDHPALRNHKIQLRPSFTLPHETSKNKSSVRVPPQIWHKSGSCPLGTVPIRRVGEQELLRAASVEHFGREGPRNHSAEIDKSFHVVNLNGTEVRVYDYVDYSNAYLITAGYNYIGARGEINVWNPRVDAPDEYTTAQIWLKHGPGDSFESIEVGWMVNPSFFGDRVTRLFIRWTLDGYAETGCINLVCSGFVQTSEKIALGSALEPVSQRGGNQYQMYVRVDHDPNTGNWWLYYGDEVLGYWPGSLFSYLKQSATIVEWGGEVYSKKVKTHTPHTTTAMGSGDFASGLWGTASYINKLRIVDYSLQEKYPELINVFSEEPDCYSAYNYQQSLAFEPIFYFGGPGRNRYCP